MVQAPRWSPWCASIVVVANAGVGPTGIEANGLRGLSGLVARLSRTILWLWEDGHKTGNVLIRLQCDFRVGVQLELQAVGRRTRGLRM